MATPMWMQRLAEREAVCRGMPAAMGRAHSFGFRVIALVYSVFFFVEPWGQRSVKVWSIFALVYVLFVALFLGIPYTRGKLRIALFAVFFALGFLYTPFNQSATGLFVYPMALIPFLVHDTRRVISILTIQVAAIVSECLMLNLNIWAYAMGAFFTVVVTLSNLFFAYRADSERKLNLAQDEIERMAKVAERERIARDLHDVLGHTLTLVVLKSQVAEQLITSDPEQAGREVAEIQETARKALREVREAVLGYRTEGLRMEMERAKETLSRAGIVCEQRMEPEALSAMLSREQEMALSLVVREAVTNMVRHSAATQSELHVAIADGMVRAQMRDDGKGGSAEGGFGLRGMRERVEALGGSLQIDGSAGMTLRVELPLKRGEAGA